MWPTILSAICIAGALGVIFTAMAALTATWRRGKRVGIWESEEERRRAALAAGASPAVAENLARGYKINAIKAYREETGLGLKEAKDAVDQVESTLYRYEPWGSVWEMLAPSR